jgi:hypothetical protein
VVPELHRAESDALHRTLDVPHVDILPEPDLPGCGPGAALAVTTGAGPQARGAVRRPSSGADRSGSVPAIRHNTTRLPRSESVIYLSHRASSER